ncbi:MAG: TIGR04283 family arsenosugar biosynthesis glycosyltransferase [Ramlibacter sp.]
MASVRIVIPVLQEGAQLRVALAALQPLRALGAEVVVVDGGSTDATWALARAGSDILRLAPRGRAPQMNAGAAGSTADALLFLHADTRLPPDAWAQIEAALAAGHSWGRFDVRIDGKPRLLRVVAHLMNLRSQLTGIATGDQAMFVRRAVFEAEGGFAPLPLMEDIELSARLRRRSRPACLPGPVVTSGRRWEQRGVLRTIVLMWRLRAQYFLGAAPQQLARRYGYGQPATAVPECGLAVMAKAPVPGLAKTRLSPLLGMRGAARVQRRFLLDALHLGNCVALGLVTLWCAPDAGHPLFRVLAGRGIDTRSQPAGNLGQRMAHAMKVHFSRHPQLPWIVIGTDCPLLAPGHLQQAARALADHDAVILPAQDGGYAMLGLRRPLPQVFEGIDWSTPAVLQQTRDRLRAAGARWLELETLWDVDEPADWQRWRDLLGETR